MRMAALWILGCLAGAGAGWLAGPWLSRSHYAVQTAEAVYARAAGLTGAETEDQALRAEAVREQGLAVAPLYESARQIRRQFQRGGMLFGLWCALAIGARIAWIRRERAPRIYETDRADCVACARCFWSCPVEREWRKSKDGLGADNSPGLDSAQGQCKG